MSKARKVTRNTVGRLVGFTLRCEKEDNSERAYVYVISNPTFPGWLKIGKASNVKSRLSVYQTADPLRRYKLEFCAFVKDPKKYEKMFKARCDGKLEWFTGLTVDKAIEMINELKSQEK